MPSSWKKNLDAALRSPTLRVALDRATAAYMERRRQTFATIDFEGLRRQLRARKEAAIEALPALLDQFAAAAATASVTVYRAADADAANRYLLELARSRDARLAVKAKSMTTEEIGLNHYLEQGGLRVVETDLGEWILQLAHDRPSHMTAPAIHKTKEEVAALFSQHVGQTVPPDIPEMVQLARRELRRAFIEADLGISGANALIAESGTLMLVTNEGNGRLVTTLPPVHAAVVGIEKVVPTLDDATLILKLLAPSATGQPATAYVSFITGPSRSSDIERVLTLGVHGPGEVHIVLLDNGRSAIRDDPDFREALYCIKCAACLNMCPVFQTVGGHSYGHIYTGGIGVVLTALLHGMEHAADPMQLCLGCGRCTDVCPVGIDIPRLMLALRRRVVEQKGLPLSQRLASALLARPQRLERATQLGRLLQRPFVSPNGLIRNLPLRPALTKGRSLPALPKHSLAPRSSPPALRATQATIFAGCLGRFVYPSVAEAAATALDRLGVGVRLTKDEVCCGAPTLHWGDTKAVLELARTNLAALAGAEHVIYLCPACGEALKYHYPGLLADDDRWAGRAQELAPRVRDLSEFVVDVVGLSRLGGVADGVERKLTYHDPCLLARRMGVRQPPRQLLRSMDGVSLVEMADADACCGLSGTYWMSFPEITDRVFERKLAAVRDSGADTVATACLGWGALCNSEAAWTRPAFRYAPLTSPSC